MTGKGVGKAVNAETIVSAILRDWRRSSFVWGMADCMLSTADYAGQLNGTDPGAPYRGTYSTEAAAMALVEAAGGGAAILGVALTANGFTPISEPRRGDPVCAQFGASQIGGVCLGDFSAFRTPSRGVIEIRTSRIHIVGAWSP